jgi:putative FmdB family regulatory protein
MPTYSYKCTKCAHEFDVQQSITDDAIATCPECKGKLQKVFGKVGVTFKGTGFYRTDKDSSGKPSKES